MRVGACMHGCACVRVHVRVCTRTRTCVLSDEQDVEDISHTNGLQAIALLGSGCYGVLLLVEL